MATTIDSITVKGVKVPLIFEQDTRLPIVSMQAVFQNSGSIEDGNASGLAKFSAKMMNEGTRSLGANGFAQALERRAIHLSAHTGTETFVFEMGSLKEEFDEAASLLASLLTEPNLSEESLRKVRTLTLGSLSRKQNDYDYVADNMIKSLLFEGSVLAQPALGTPQSVEAVTLKQVETFVHSHLTLSNAIIVIGGDLTLEEAKAQGRRVLEPLDVGETKALVRVPTSEKPEEKIEQRTTEQAYVYFGSPYEMSVGDPEYHKARVATFILGTGGFGSRLMEEIRVKRGLAYSAYARIAVNRSHSYFNGYLQTKVESMEEAVSTVRSVIADFVEHGVSAEELEQAKKFLLGSEPLRVETLSQRLSRTFMEYYRGEGIGYAKAELERIRELNLDDLNRFIKAHAEINRLSFAIVTQ